MNLIYSMQIHRYSKVLFAFLLLAGLSFDPAKSLAQCNPGTVTAIAASNTGCSSFTANWNVPTGTVTDYYIDISTHSDFSISLAGYPQAIGSTGTFYSITGLSPSSIYYYRVKGINGGVCFSTSWSNIITVLTQANSATCQCTPVNDLVCATDYISNVTINTLNNNSGCGTGGYSFYSPTGTQTTTLAIDSTYTLSLTTGGSNPGIFGAGVWFDFNHNVFLTDAGEFFNISNIITTGSTISQHITIPLVATPGFTTMRIRYGLNSVIQSEACTMPDNTDGETEDYTVCLYNTINIPTPPQNTITCVGSIPTLLVAATGSVASYQWYSSPTSANTGGTPISGATNATYSPPPSVYNTLGTYYYYCVLGSICGGTGITTPAASSASLQVNPVPTVASITTIPTELCIGNPLILKSVGETGVGTPVYTFTGPNGLDSIVAADSTIFTPSTIFASGIYSLVVTYPGAGCRSNSVSSFFTIVNDSPTVSGFSATPTPLCVGSTMTFFAATASGTGPVTSYVWAGPHGFRDTSASNSINFTPSVTASSGKYYVSVIYPGEGCISAPDTANVVQVDTFAAAVTGNAVICLNKTTTFHNTTPVGGGIGWTSSDPSVANIDPVTGVVTTVGSGTTTVTWNISNSCGTSVSSVVLTVNPLPLVITNNAPVCVGLQVCLSDASANGTWSSSSVSIANINGTTGCITGGPTSGTANITYTLPTGCITTAVATVNPLPVAIAGTKNVCYQLTTHLSDATPGGTWSSSNPSIGSIGTDGTVTGVAVGSATITYTLPTSCIITTQITVNPLPQAILGTPVVCVGYTTLLSDQTSGGTWSSSVAAQGSIGTDGTVTGRAQGVPVITYTLPTGCIATQPVTVNPLSAILGTPAVCFGLNMTLSDTTAGGTWSSSNGNAVIGSTGIVAGNIVGSSTITYLLPTGCAAYVNVTVNPLPGIINGIAPVCSGSIVCLTDASPGGAWSTGNPLVATIGTTGCLTGAVVATSGTVTVTYTLPTGCLITAINTVNPLPLAITGTASACSGLTSCLTDASGGGAWSSASLNVNVGSAGCITSIVAGPATATISYTLPTTCRTTTIFTVNPLPGTILGAGKVCTGATITLSDAGGGTWSSFDPTIATIGTSGTVTGVSTVTATVPITYTLPTGCIATKTITVNQLPSAIQPAGDTVCASSSITLSDTTAGGTWSSISPKVTVGSITGNVAGVAQGTATISYTLVTGCAVTQIVTVNPLPQPISGLGNLCQGVAACMSDASVGGTWSSTGLVIDPLTGCITPLTVGTSAITYTLPTGCLTTTTETVNALPSDIAFVTIGQVCPGSNITLTDPTPGGTWSSGATGVATIASTGVVTGVAGGTATITYANGSGCIKTIIVTVNPAPAGISGAPNICLGSSSTLSDSPTGGTWTSSNGAVATIGTDGLVTSVGSGTSTVLYTLPTTCAASLVVTVVPAVANITGTMNVCSGSVRVLSDATIGGTWSSVGAATVDPTSGAVTGTGASGSATITYTLGTCIASTGFTVNPLPANITGTTNVCSGLSTTLTDGTPGVVWSSSASGIAAVGSTGIVTAGTVTVTTTVTINVTAAGCSVSTIVTVNPLPAAITGSGTVCSGANLSLSDAAGGGTWSSSNTSLATVGSTSGIVTGQGVSAGTAAIIYTLPTGCTTATSVNVIASIPGITGTASNCPQFNITLSDAVSGGTWSSDNASVATVGSTGVVADVTPGTATISYSLGGLCVVSKVVTFNTVPAITGNTNICIGGTSLLSDATSGGTWSSTVGATATIGTTGLVTSHAVGSSTISYILPGGCNTTITVSVLPSVLPAINGTLSVCKNATTTLSDADPTGTWTSSNGNATVVGSTGVVTGVTAPGTATITYKIGAGCQTTAVVTVNSLPSPISGASVMCQNTSITLSDLSTPGTFSSGTIAVSPTGTVTATAAGTYTVGYSITGTGCATSTTISVNPAPTAILGSGNVCYLGSTIMSDATSGGTWSSSNPSIVFVFAGETFGVAVGTATITYQLTATGCNTSTVITVNPLPASIAGIVAVCAGLTTTLSDAVTGGTWASDNGTVASINGTSGTVTGVAAGTANITYTSALGCTTDTAITILQSPAAITGTFGVCFGGNTTLTDTVIGGTWTSSSAGIANIGSSTGSVTGAGTGTATITYTISDGCSQKGTFTVNPYPQAITGAASVCAGSQTTLSSVTTGYTWSSSNTAAATINPTTGVVTGIAGGQTTIAYTSPAGCAVTTTLNVLGVVGAISGTANTVCTGLTITLSDSTTGGTWTSSNSNASVGSASGIVTGGANGTATITYTAITGCFSTAVVNVSTTPPISAASFNVCPGATINLSDATTGGTWTSSANVSIGSTGVVTGISPGTASITYTLGIGCHISATVTVNGQPINGNIFICEGASTTLTDAETGGTWSSTGGNISVTGSTGSVLGLTAGTALVSYQSPLGCTVITTVSVINTLDPITAPGPLCVGTSTTLSNATTGGSWTSSNTGIATIGSATGSATGVAAGTVTITYTLGSGCNTTATLTVNPLSNINGTPAVCAGLTTILSDLTTGGSWTSGSSNATVGSTGIVSGVTAGTASITYSLPTGCATATVVTVNALAPITGPSSVCVGSNINLSDAVSGGTWTSCNGDVSIGPATGIILGITPGTACITVLLPDGCSATTTVTVNPISPILGTPVVCVGLNVSVSDLTTGGIWSSSNGNATIGSASGIITGQNAGTTVFTYSLPTGCTATTVATINALAPVSGAGSVCVGSNITLTDAVTGGTWMGDNNAIATIGTSGIVNGMGAGSVHITYTLPSGCTATTVVTVNPISSILGTPVVCAGLNITLNDATPGGNWTSSNANATIGFSSGILTGVNAGTATISYALPTGCSAMTVVTVNALAPITGINAICLSGFTTLSDAAAGGTWSSGVPAVATVGSLSGVAVAQSIGTTVITYTLPTGCSATDTISVISALAGITGTTNECIGLPYTLTDPVSGGVWSSSNTGVAGIGSASGIVSGSSVGSATITYSIGTGCVAVTSISINPLPAVITGTFNVCTGLSTTLSNDTTGGVWSSSNPAAGSIGSASGTLAGITAGSTNITYTTPAGCIATATFTVNQTPQAISGILSICPNSTTALSDTLTGGNWASSMPAVGSIDPVSGLVATLTTGTSVITYTMPTGCMATTTLNVVDVISPITGSLTVCTGRTTTLSDALTGGGWTIAGINATIDPASGMVTGTLSGTSAVTYTLGTGCSANAVVTINSAPKNINGATAICLGTGTILTDSTTGGTWSTGNTNITLGSVAGNVFALGVGVDTIIYTALTGCTTSHQLTINALPARYHVGGGGSYCTFAEGVDITLSGSDTGVTYVLYHGSTAGTDTAGTDSMLHFGLQALATTYTVLATNNTTGCANKMLDSAVVTITAALIPSISISTTADTVCAGAYTTFTASIVNGGTAPVYEWQVNGTSPGADSAHYSYIPADGDIVSVKLTSNAECTFPDTAIASKTMAVVGNKLPGMSITILPGDTLCAGSAAVFVATDSFGGPAPVFTWIKDGVVTATGSTYMFTPYLPDNGSVIYCRMASNYACRTVDTVTSGYIRLTIDTTFIPFITLTATPGTTILHGQADTITATVINGGISPSYQWVVNTTPIAGATTNVFISDTLSAGDSVTCVVYGSGLCGLYTFNSALIITDGVLNVQQATAGTSDIRLIPNPNNGTFTIRGTLATIQDEEVTVEITDLLGQVVFKNKVMAMNGKINEQVKLNSTLTNGMYSLSLQSQHEHKVFHLVVEQ